MVNGVVEALLLVSPAEQRVLSVNRQFETLFSIDTSQVVGRRLDELQPQLEQIFAEPDALLERVAGTSNDQAATFTETFKQVWPQERLLELFSAPVLSDDHFLGRLFGFRDVTQERELDRMKTEFVSQVSHELRTPLTAIKGFTDMVLDGDAGDVNEEQAEYLGIVRSNVDRLMALINDLLDIARIESGRVQLKLEPTDVAEIVKLVGQSLRPLVEGKDQTLSTEIEPELPVAMATTTASCRSSPTWSATPTSTRRRVGRSSFGRADCDDGMLRIDVQDNGMGIPPEDVPKLFSRFFRVDSSLTREIGGTGLGLSIVKSIVELHGGTVSVDSAPGQRFDLRVHPAIASATVGAHRHRAERTVLLVDGEAGVADELGQAGYRVQTAENAAARAGQAEQQRPDLIVLRLRLANRGCLEEAHGLAEAAERNGHSAAGASRSAEPPTPAALRPAMDDALLVDRVQRTLTEDGHRRVLVIEDDASIRRLLSANLQQPRLRADRGCRRRERACSSRASATRPGDSRPAPAGHRRLHGPAATEADAGHGRHTR